MRSNSLLEVEHLAADYGYVRALHDVTMSVEAGSITAIVGANGAGKTTLLRTLSGALRPAAGSTIRLGGSSLVGRRPDAIVGRGLAMVPEGRRVFTTLSVRENVLLGGYLRLKRGDKAAVMADLDAMYALFPRLRERAGQLAGTLSGGEQQMVAIARALMARPTLLLLDEPSMGLAPLVIADIFRTILRLNADGMTILLAEQNARMALRIAHRAYVLETGRLVRQGSAKELANDPEVQRIYMGVSDSTHTVPATPSSSPSPSHDRAQ